MTSYPLSYHRITVKACPPLDFPIPEFIGSMLRGALGVALKRLKCINPTYECHDCFAQNQCTFFDFYEKPKRAHLFRLAFSLNPNNIQYDLYLFEHACKELPYFLSATERLFHQVGLGRLKTRIPLNSILVNDQDAYDGHVFLRGEFEPALFIPEELSSPLKVHFHTPLRMKFQQTLLREIPPLDHFLRSILFRYSEIKGLPLNHPQTSLSGEILPSSQMNFTELTRFSNRQKQKMQMGGLLGELHLNACSPDVVELLHLGSLIGVGKQTSFGLGHYTLEALNEAH